jgi:hypothetical protein
MTYHVMKSVPINNEHPVGTPIGLILYSSYLKREEAEAISEKLNSRLGDRYIIIPHDEWCRITGSEDAQEGTRKLQFHADELVKLLLDEGLGFGEVTKMLNEAIAKQFRDRQYLETPQQT